MTYTVEITKVEAKKLVSLDRQYKVTIVCDDPKILELAKYINERTVEIEVKE